MNKEEFFKENVQLSEDELRALEIQTEELLHHLSKDSHGYTPRTLGLLTMHIGFTLLTEKMLLRNIGIDDAVIQLEKEIFEKYEVTDS